MMFNGGDESTLTWDVKLVPGKYKIDAFYSDNEEYTINHKLNNLLDQTYPKELMEVIIIDSNSEDNTINIVRNFKKSQSKLDIKIITENTRRGKSHSINKAFSSAKKTSEILFMTDADSILKKDALEKIVLYLENPEIGAVSGVETILNLNESRETKLEGTYIEYYKKMRLGESNLDSCVIFGFIKFKLNLLIQ